jgi:hypothetical protein
LKYQSLEDWTEARDLLRCNPSFHDERRYDYVIVNTDLSTPGNLVLAHLYGLYHCRLFSNESCDLALVRMLHPSKWKPRTIWDGCRIYDEMKEPQFIMPQYLVRGAHMISVFEANTVGRVYLNDLIDNDMFLRAGN